MNTNVVFAAILALGLAWAAPSWAEGFTEDFDGPAIALDAEASTGWAYWTGDGEATMAFTQAQGHGTIEIDARQDRRNIWWALIRRSVTAYIDAESLARPDRELRVESRIRASAAPRRVNLHFNHTRTTDFHSHLMEYDLPDTDWHVISFTTRGFDAGPQDEVFVQMAMIDWGRELYRVDIDYIKVDLVDPATAGPDLGAPLPYRPAIAPLETFAHALPAAEDAIIDAAYPWVNLQHWTDRGDPARPLLSAVSGSQIMLLRWDMSAYRGAAPAGWGVLALKTHAAQLAATELEEFGELRVVEILGGDAQWTRASVTFDSFLAGKPISEVLNGQMMIDIPPAYARGETTFIPVSPPVLARLISGRTKGLAIYAQGALNAAFYSGASANPADAPRLYFNTR